ncbi:MAG TPA: thioesterase [Chitinophagaceae bacterium]|nr:thioesterase [Chitinophagaceae bacterium]HNE94055.1 thioesterase [Chitinophagaceae bacterium]HNF29494.1 thioesterase [Chitinophagaceae bacterium]HNJ59463.1 thioesterase [Chitinophagaceae bacterium]HNM34653.1 thioesterase [Chitinophagaceae bacterium]
MNIHFTAFKKVCSNRLKLNLFLLTKLPMVFFSGIKLKEFSNEKSITTVNYKWINQNPFNSIYFAVLSMAAELSTGLLAFGNIYKRKPKVSMLVIKMESFFYKKAVGKISFICKDGLAIEEAIEKAIAYNNATPITCTSIGINEQNEIVAKFIIEWSFKSKPR